MPMAVTKPGQRRRTTLALQAAVVSHAACEKLSAFAACAGISGTRRPY